MARRKVLFVGEGISLAHVVRPLRLLEHVAAIAGDAELHVAYDFRYRPLFPGLRAVEHPLPARRPEIAQRDLFHLRPLYGERRLDRYLADDLAVIDTVRPDLVVYDLRPTIPVAAALRGIPAAAIINAYHSPFARGRSMVPDSLAVRVLGPALAGVLWRLSPETFSAIVLAPLARFRERHGLPAPRGDVLGLFGADTVLFPDADHFARTPGAPARHHRIGPLIWRPEWPGAGLADLPAGFGRRRPLVYVCLGSSGDVRLLPAAVEGAAAAGADVLVATGGRALPRPLPRGERILVRPYVDGDEASRRAALVVANGGNPQMVQAFAAGRPVLGLPSNVDQSLNMMHAEATGAARALHPARVTAARVRRHVEALLDEPGPRVAAEGQAALIGAIDVGQRVAGALLPFL